MVTEENIDKFLYGKLLLTKAKVLAALPRGYYDLKEGFLPLKAETLPPYRVFNYKIKLILSRYPLNFYARLIS